MEIFIKVSINYYKMRLICLSIKVQLHFIMNVRLQFKILKLSVDTVKLNYQAEGRKFNITLLY